MYIAGPINQKKKDKRGFTLVELMAVLAVLAIIAAIAVPRFTGTINAAKVKADESSALIIARAAEQKWLDDGEKNKKEYTSTELHEDGYLRKAYTAQHPDHEGEEFVAIVNKNGVCNEVHYDSASGDIVGENK
jgi:type IV pilus assembly protein PilA